MHALALAAAATNVAIVLAMVVNGDRIMITITTSRENRAVFYDVLGSKYVDRSILFDIFAKMLLWMMQC